MKNKIFKLNIILGAIALTGCSTSDVKGMFQNGSAVATTSTVHLAPADPSKVKIYFTPIKQRHYIVVGRVAADNFNMVAVQHSQSFILEELKKQAASLGANAVIDVASELTQTTGVAIVIK